MAGLTFNPQFHAALLSTLREGVIHLALPQPEIARQPDFPAQALQDLLGVTQQSRLDARFEAATDLIQFATRTLTETARPPVLAPLWGSEPWKPENSLMEGLFHYLEEITEEACQVLGETSFQLSLQVWNEPDNPENWEILADHLEAQEIGWMGRSLQGEVLSERLRRDFPKDLFQFKSLTWKMGFLTEAYARGFHPRDLLRLQLVPETRLLRRLTYRLGFHFSGFAIAQEFASTLPGSRVTALDLTINQIGVTGAQALAEVLPRSRVAALGLSFNEIGDTGVQALAEVLPRSQVTLLGLACNQIGDAGAQDLAKALAESQVRHLELDGNRFGNDGVQALAEVLPRSQVTHLDLRGNQFSNDGVQALAEALPRSQVTHLDLGINQIRDAGVQSLAEVLPRSQVTKLHLRASQFGVAGAQALAKVLPMSQVTQLDLGDNGIRDAGAKALAEVLPRSQVTQLDLDNNRISDTGAQALAESLPESRVTKLDLSGNQISDAMKQVLNEVAGRTGITIRW